ncbi:MAG: hypothetical protein KJN89_07470 [Gammaproteobacteria bacterium]|nr:hypothetical protein [Gammaproteobacteria bacterium]NNJ50202.1 hypothetical protein [Gammaproteobacteria bacterium]
MKSDLIKSKLKASAIHLSISALIFIGILYLILVEWYPGVFFSAEGGWDGIKLMAAVDLVLGPSLTFIIYNHMKARKEIVLDLSLVAVVQISALIWGGLQVYSERPVALVMWDGIFYTVTEDYYKKQDISLEDVAAFSDEEPLLIYAEADYSLQKLEELQRLNLEKIPPYAQVHLYKSIKEHRDEVFENQISSDAWSEYLQEDLSQSNDHVFLGKAKYKNLLIYLDSEADLVEMKVRQ